jgi:hypothetical protein
MAKLSINNFRDVCCLTSFSISVAALVSFTPQSTFASQNWGKAEVEEFVGSISPSEDEWLDFYVTGTHSPDAAETYAIKRNKVGTGMEGVCLQRPANTKDTTRGHCGASAVWVKGDHSKNKTVRYRTSLTRYSIKCYRWEYSKDQFLAYNAAGKVISQWEKLGQLRAIVPESFEERIAKAHCKKL